MERCKARQWRVRVAWNTKTLHRIKRSGSKPLAKENFPSTWHDAVMRSGSTVGAAPVISAAPCAYEVLKNAKFRCELCGIPADERALEVDHILPRNMGGTDEIANLQALCFSCNAMKRDRDDTDFRAVRREYDRREQACPFCSIPIGDVLIENTLGVAIRDKYPVTDWHVLVVPKRHTADYFDLGTAESRACQRLITEARSLVCKTDPSVAGFNVGINSGQVAGQTVMHCHVHLIPRRTGDHPNPRGGMRAVISSEGGLHWDRNNLRMPRGPGPNRLPTRGRIGRVTIRGPWAQQGA